MTYNCIFSTSHDKFDWIRCAQVCGSDSGAYAALEWDQDVYHAPISEHQSAWYRVLKMAQVINVTGFKKTLRMGSVCDLCNEPF